MIYIFFLIFIQPNYGFGFSKTNQQFGAVIGQKIQAQRKFNPTQRKKPSTHTL